MTTSKTKEQRDYSVYMATATVRCFHSVSEFKTQGEKKMTGRISYNSQTEAQLTFRFVVHWI